MTSIIIIYETLMLFRFIYIVYLILNYFHLLTAKKLYSNMAQLISFSNLSITEPPNLLNQSEQLKKQIRNIFKSKNIHCSLTRLQSAEKQIKFQITFQLQQQDQNFNFQIVEIVCLTSQKVTAEFCYSKAQLQKYFREDFCQVITSLNIFDNLNIKQAEYISKIYSQKGSIKIKSQFFYKKNQEISPIQMKKYFNQLFFNFKQIHLKLLQKLKFQKEGKTNNKYFAYKQQVSEQKQQLFTKTGIQYMQNKPISQVIRYFRIFFAKKKMQKLQIKQSQIMDKNLQVLTNIYITSDFKKTYVQYKKDRQITENYYKTVTKVIKNYIEAQNKNSWKLVIPIKINEIKKLKLLNSDSKNIFQVNATYRKNITCNSYLFQKSFNQIYNQDFHKQKKQQQQIQSISGENIKISQNKNLIMKVKKTKIQDKFSSKKIYQNQIRFLFNNREKKCSSLATYYLEQMQNNLNKNQKYWMQKQRFFIQKYQKTFYQMENDLKQIPMLYFLVNCMYKVMIGIKFMHQNKYLHHDIKKQNIMIDQKLNPKIIDFQGTYKFQNEKQIKQTLHTQEYYLDYNNLNDFDGSIHKKYTKQKYDWHQYYDMYSYGKVFHDSVDNITRESLVKYSLQGLIFSCTEQDPENRMSPDECLAILYLLKKHLQNQNQKLKMI